MHKNRIVTLIIIIMFTLAQLTWAGAGYCLRPVAFDETTSPGEEGGGNRVNRRGFNFAAIASAFLPSALKALFGQSPIQAQEAKALFRDEGTMARFRFCQENMLSGRHPEPLFRVLKAAVVSKERNHKKYSVSAIGVQRARLRYEREVETNAAHNKVLSAMAENLKADTPQKKLRAWGGLVSAADGYFAAEIKYWKRSEEIEAGVRRASLIKLTNRRRQVEIVRDVYKKMAFLGCSFYPFDFPDVLGDSSYGLWQTLPPITNPWKRSLEDKRKEAFDAIKEGIKNMLVLECGCIREDIASVKRKMDQQEKDYRKKYISKSVIERYRDETKAWEDSCHAQIGVLYAQMEQVDKLETPSDALPDAIMGSVQAVLNRIGVEHIVAQEELGLKEGWFRKGWASGLELWGARQKAEFIKGREEIKRSEQRLRELALKLGFSIGAEASSALTDLATTTPGHSSYLPFMRGPDDMPRLVSVSPQQVLKKEAVEGVVEPQVFVPANALSLDVPISRQELEETFSEARDSFEAQLEERAALAESMADNDMKAAQARISSWEKQLKVVRRQQRAFEIEDGAESRGKAKKTGFERKDEDYLSSMKSLMRHGVDSEVEALEDSLQKSLNDYREAQIRKEEARIIRLNNAIFDAGGDRKKAEGLKSDRDVLILHILTRQLGYVCEQIDQLKARKSPLVMAITTLPLKIDDLEYRRQKLASRLREYQMLKDQGCHLPGLVPPRTAGLSVSGIGRVATTGKAKYARYRGRIQRRLPDGKTKTTSVMNGGLLDIGPCVVADTLGGQDGKNTLYKNGKEALSQLIEVGTCDMPGFFPRGGLDKRSVGSALLELSGFIMSDILPGGTYNVAVIKGMSAIADEPMLMGTVQDDPRGGGKTRYLYAYPIYGEEEREFTLRDGRVVKRNCMVPKEIMFYTTLDVGGEPEADKDSPADDPLYKAGLNKKTGNRIWFKPVSKRRPATVRTNDGMKLLKIKEPDPRYPWEPFSVEKVDFKLKKQQEPLPALEDLMEKEQSRLGTSIVVDGLRRTYPFVDFNDIEALATKQPALAVQVARQLHTALGAVDPEVLRIWRGDYGRWLLRQFGPDLDNVPADSTRVIKIGVKTQGQFMHLETIDRTGELKPARFNMRIKEEGIVDSGELDRTGAGISDLFYLGAVYSSYKTMRRAHPRVALRGIERLSGRDAYDVVRGISEALKLLSELDQPLVPAFSDSSGPVIKIRQEDTGQAGAPYLECEIDGVTTSEPIRIRPGIGVDMPLSELVSRELVAGYLHLPPRESGIWEELLIPEQGDANHQFRRAVRIYLGIDAFQAGEDKRAGQYKLQCAYVESLLNDGPAQIAERESIARTAKLKKLTGNIVEVSAASAPAAGAVVALSSYMYLRLSKKRRIREDRAALGGILRDKEFRERFLPERYGLLKALKDRRSSIKVEFEKGYGGKYSASLRMSTPEDVSFDSFDCAVELARECRYGGLEARVVEVNSPCGKAFITAVKIGDEWKNITRSPQKIIATPFFTKILTPAEESSRYLDRQDKGVALSEEPQVLSYQQTDEGAFLYLIRMELKSATGDSQRDRAMLSPDDVVTVRLDVVHLDKKGRIVEKDDNALILSAPISGLQDLAQAISEGLNQGQDVQARPGKIDFRMGGRLSAMGAGTSDVGIVNARLRGILSEVLGRLELGVDIEPTARITPRQNVSALEGV